MITKYDPALAENLAALKEIAREIGAKTFIIRNADSAELVLTLGDEPDQGQFNLVLEPPHPVIFLAVFTSDDGGEPGIESS
jgi:hypothetical protein